MSLTKKQKADLKSWHPSLRPMMLLLAKSQNKRIKEAGKHRCVKVKNGAARRVTGRGGKILKRPILLMQFYECKLCGRDMGYTNGASRFKKEP